MLILRSLLAVVAAFVVVIVLSTGTDFILHQAHVYPPDGQPMDDPGLNALALSYRLAFQALGGWVTARLAPAAPIRHVLVVGAIGTLLAALGAMAAAQAHLGPLWYPIALVVTAIPSTGLGGWIATRRTAQGAA